MSNGENDMAENVRVDNSKVAPYSDEMQASMLIFTRVCP